MTIWRQLIIYENSTDLSFTKRWSTSVAISVESSVIRAIYCIAVIARSRFECKGKRCLGEREREREMSCANYPLGNREFTLLLYLSSYQFRANLKFATGRTILATMRPNVRSLNRYHARRSSSLGSSQPSSATRWIRLARRMNTKRFEGSGKERVGANTRVKI